MKKQIILILLITSFLLIGCNKNKVKAVKHWSTPATFSVPESVMYDSKRDILYISNINGKPLEKNGKGFISRLSLKGKVIQLKWIKGLNAPKGMAIKDNTLYVTDIDRIHTIDISKGKIKTTINEPSAEFLNDIAVCPAGNVYISDMKSGIIYMLQNKTLKPFINLKKFLGSNGMLIHGQDLLVGTKTGIIKVDLKAKKASLHVKVNNYGMIDGLKAYDDKSFIISNWQGETRLVTVSGKTTVLLDTVKENIQSADLEYIPGKKLLLIPTFFNNRVVAYKIQ